MEEADKDWMMIRMMGDWLVGWLEFNVPFQHKYGYIRDERSGWREPLT